ncbi:aminopeptidase [Aestuariirhabdus sp. LZHN29]|uniref:aminopeptidase n=1 Tax=Aestuariirhabdus sp. LZHN29 TaxID=3417462 RepID=UPI003CEBDC03
MFMLGGCEAPGYYWQAGEGQWQLLHQRQEVAELIESEQTPEQLRERLLTSQQMIDFAHQALKLPDNGSYRHYVDLERPYVVWNLFASEEFLIEPYQWCYPVAGCLNYRGYFDPESADQAATKMAQQGFDTWVGGVRAYSTLGWFSDPLLNTFIYQQELGLAELIFHEMAHQRVFAKGDTEFNESLATVIANEGVRRWALRSNLHYDRHEVETERNNRQAFALLVKETRDQLQALYRRPLDDSTKRAQKQQVLQQLRIEYQRRRRAQWQTFDRYDDWVAGDLNNAKLSTVSSYYRWVPLFESLLQESDRDLDALYSELDRLAAMPPQKRRGALHKLETSYNK